MNVRIGIAALALAAIASGGFPSIRARAGTPAPAPPPPPVASYADLADLADSAPLVLRAEVRKLAALEPGRAPGVRPGWGRFYVEARVKALIAGGDPVGESLRFLADLPLDAKGKPPRLGKKQVLLFAAAVAGRPGELRLTAPDAMLPWDPGIESRLRAVLTELLAPGAPGPVSSLREAIYVPGTLAGEGETQMFLAAPGGGAASITVAHRPGAPAAWGVSFSEVLENGAPPRPETLAWYRLACFLPPALPPGANLSESPRDRDQAEEDYRFVMRSLGPCARLRR